VRVRSSTSHMTDHRSTSEKIRLVLSHHTRRSIALLLTTGRKASDQGQIAKYRPTRIAIAMRCHSRRSDVAPVVLSFDYEARETHQSTNSTIPQPPRTHTSPAHEILTQSKNLLPSYCVLNTSNLPSWILAIYWPPLTDNALTTRFEHSSRVWVIDDFNQFHGPVRFNKLMFLRDDRTELHQIWAGNRTIIGTLTKLKYISDMLLRFDTRPLRGDCGRRLRPNFARFDPLLGLGRGGRNDRGMRFSRVRRRTKPFIFFWRGSTRRSGR